MLRKLDYQDRALSALDDYLAALNAAKANADAVAAFAAANPGVRLDVPDFARDAWKAVADAGKLPASRANIPHDPRKDGIGRPVPNAVLKVPTGGGKTFLAVQSLSRVFGQYLKKNTGFVLWIVPNEAIYAQTLRHLADRQHPYRAVLDRVSAGRVRIFEKTDRLDKRDIDANLCVMLLMLQSANRETNETLRMFRDRGDVHGFVPPEGEQDKHQDLLRLIPNLDAYGGTLIAMVKESLGNALRITRPVVVMDEGHRATSDLAYRTLYGFNPCFVLELTATPKDVQPRGGRNPAPGRYQNVLVEVTGKELDREGMIKMPLNLDPRQGTDWRTTLTAALDKLRELADDAAKLRADTNRYIRPIMLVQVERTGKDQRGAGIIHAKDVREWLKTAGFDDAEIAVKTAETNDLSQPENQDLLSPTNRVRAIITKSALQEGWDCPFAYVLCSLAAQNNLSAMTQLVGRILRQPSAEKTEVAALDECYVITHHAATAEVVDAIKKGLEGDGLGDLVLHVAASDSAPGGRRHAPNQSASGIQRVGHLPAQGALDRRRRGARARLRNRRAVCNRLARMQPDNDCGFHSRKRQRRRSPIATLFPYRRRERADRLRSDGRERGDAPLRSHLRYAHDQRRGAEPVRRARNRRARRRAAGRTRLRCGEARQACWGHPRHTSQGADQEQDLRAEALFRRASGAASSSSV